MTSKIRKSLNFIIGLLKWPSAIAMLILVLPAFQVDLELLSRITSDMNIIIYFFAPLIASAFLFLLAGLSGSFLVIMEHELTHMLFAVLTFHKPAGLEVEQGVGGYFSFRGEGNWMIALAPYFFPTFAFVVMLASLFFPANQNVYLTVLGGMLGYHIVATILEIHPKQTDFKVAGYIFTFCFLPGINMIVYGLVFGFVLAGWDVFPAYFNALWAKTSILIQHFRM